MVVNRKYKDRLFRMVFQEKESLLELYNAIHGTWYTDASALEITTIQDAIYMGMKNDVSFLIGDVLNLYEHQSTVNPNMGVRGMLYLADLYRKYLKSKGLNLYSRSLIRLPLPVYFIFYNGLEGEPDRTELYLSDCFEKVPGMAACLECKAILLNINLGHNRELMERCKTLRDYAELVHQVRTFQADGLELEDAVHAAVTSCINSGIMAEWLSLHRAEVMDVFLSEYNEQEHIRLEREESRAEGKAEGKADSILELLQEVGEVPDGLQSIIAAQSDLAVLSRWLKLAARTETIDQFWKTIKSE